LRKKGLTLSSDFIKQIITTRSFPSRISMEGGFVLEIKKPERLRAFEEG